MAEPILYGPPPDPRQIGLEVEVLDQPGLYAACIAIGLGISLLSWYKRQPRPLRAWWFCLGQTIALTAPLAMMLERAVYGAWPTVDKAGSLLFYLDGVHWRVTFHPLEALADPAARLIGAHMGHLWVTELFDLFLSPHGAFNAQGLLYPALGWWAATLMLRQVSDSWRVAILMAFPFGMGLHVFRDLNWYTIEKASVFALALYGWAMIRAWRHGGRAILIAGAVYVGATWLNFYWGLVGAAGAAVAVLVTPDRNLAMAAACSAACALPLILFQGMLLSGPETLGDPRVFLEQRAALDSFSLAPFRWNRLEVHRALNMIALGFALIAAVKDRRDPMVQTLCAVAAGLFALSLGPNLLPGVANPVYMALWHLLPGWWRVAKPEVFFEGTWLLLLTVGAYGLRGRRLSGAGLYPIFAIAWLVMVRTHPVYPEFSEPIEVRLGDSWRADPTWRADPAAE